MFLGMMTEYVGRLEFFCCVHAIYDEGYCGWKDGKNGFLVFAEQIRESSQIKEAESVKFVRQTEPNLFVKTATKNISSLVTKSSCRADIVY